MKEFYSLLPKNSSKLELAIEQAAYKIHTRYTEVLNYRTITKTHPLLLDWLALDNGLLVWDKLWSNEFKRSFLKTYLFWQQNAAQKNTLLDIANYFGFNGEVVVWYDQPQILPPYTFSLQLKRNSNNRFIFNDKLNIVYELVKAFKALRDDFYISFTNESLFKINNTVNFHKAQVQTSGNLYTKKQLNNIFSVNILQNKIERSRHRWMLPQIASTTHTNAVCNLNYHYAQYKTQRYIARDTNTKKHNYLPLSINSSIHYTYKAKFFAKIPESVITHGKSSQKFKLHNKIFKTRSYKKSTKKDILTRKVVSIDLMCNTTSLRTNVKQHNLQLTLSTAKNILSYLSSRYHLTQNITATNTISCLHSKKEHSEKVDIKIFRYHSTIQRHDTNR